MEKDIGNNFLGIRREDIIGIVYGININVPLVSVDFEVKILGVSSPKRWFLSLALCFDRFSCFQRRLRSMTEATFELGQ